MEDIDGGLHPAVDGQSLDEDEDVYAIVHQPDTVFAGCGATVSDILVQ